MKSTITMNKLKTLVLTAFLVAVSSFAAMAWDWSRLFNAAQSAYSAITLSDSQIQSYVKQYIDYSDRENNLAPASNAYSKRLASLTAGMTQVEGIPLNFKVYLTQDVNAFACADGSVRVYSGLMDLMNDDEILGIIGHEIGHVAHKDSKNAMKQSLINSAVLEGLASSSSKIARIADSQLAAIGQSLLNSKYSRSQENNADDYGYEFLVRNGKNPWAMAMALNKIKQLEGSGSSSKLAQLFSTHPTTTDRVDRMAERCRKDNIAKPAGCTL